MDGLPRYAVTVPSRSGTQAPPEVVVVQLVADSGTGESAVYADDTGDFRVRVNGRTAWPLSPAARASGQPFLRADPMP